MKARWMGALAGALLAIRVGIVLTGEGPIEAQPTSTTTAPPPIEPASAAAALARTSRCMECHDVDQKGIGPSFRDIGARYRDDPDARERLVATVKQGGKGNWTEVSRGVPMPPFVQRLSDAEIRRLVDWMLRL